MYGYSSLLAKLGLLPCTAIGAASWGVSMIPLPISRLHTLIAELLSFVLGVCSLGVLMTLILPMLPGGYTPLRNGMVMSMWFHYIMSYARILPQVSKWPSQFAWHLSRNGDIVQATDLSVLIVHPFLGDK